MGSEFPDAVSGQTYGLITLGRDSGELPETKKASGKTPITVPDLGELTWDDNLDWWEVTLDVPPNKAVSVSLLSDPEPPDRNIGRTAAGVVEWLRANDAAARAFAAEQKLGLYNSNWNVVKAITAEQFIKRMSLESAVRKPDGSMELWYKDGNLFQGHAIVVQVGPRGMFKRARIAG